MSAGEAARKLSRAIWIDAQLPPALALWLAREYGADAHHVLDVGLVHADDREMFDAARSGRAGVIVTKDEDFVQLLERHGPPPQIVWVTCGNVRNAVLREVVGAAWPRVVELLGAGEPLVEIGRRS